jgi:hypothetical protein
MSLKRKWEEVGEHIVSAAVGDMVSRAIATVVDKVERRAEADGEVYRLDRMVTMVSSAADAAEGVHIRSWWLRHWHWRLRDAACEGAAAMRSHRRRRAAEEEEGRRAHARAAGGPWWRWGGSAVRLLFRSANNVLFRGGATAAALRSEVARMEETASGVGEFLKLLDIEIRRQEQEGSSDLRQQPSQFPQIAVPVCRITRCAAAINQAGGEEEGDQDREDILEELHPQHTGCKPKQEQTKFRSLSVRAQLVAAVINEDEVANQSMSKPSFGRHRSGGQLVAAVINEDEEVGNQSRIKNMEGRIWVVMRLALGARVIWFALQVGSQMFRRGVRPARPSPR